MKCQQLFLWMILAALVFAVASAVAADGDVDTTFGNGGYELINWQTPGDAIPNSVAIDSSGRILIAGQAQTYRSGSPSDADFLVTRLLPNGSIDTTFAADGNGFRIYDFGLAGIGTNSVSVANDLAIQPNGSIVAAGCAFYDSVHRQFAAIRLDTSGNLDPTFANNGAAHFGFSFADVNCANSAAINALGNIVLGGELGYNNGSAGFSYYGAVARLTPMGELDPTFNSGNVLEFLYWAQPPQQAQFNLTYAIGLDGTGRTLAVGETDTPNPMSGAAIRVKSDGSLDASYGQNDRVLIPVSASTASAVFVEPSGAAVIAGIGSVATQSAIFIAKYASDGNLDPAFGNNGITTVVANTSGTATLVAPTHSGGWLVAGPFARQGVFVIKLLANGQPDTTFGNGGYLTVAFQPSAIFDMGKPALQPDGKLVVAGHLPEAAANGSADFGVMRIFADYDTIFANGFEAEP